MKKLLILFVLFAHRAPAHFVDDLRNRPYGLTEIEAKYLMENPGIKIQISDNYEYPKMYAGQFLFFPDPTKVSERYIKKVVWYEKDRWYSIPTTIPSKKRSFVMLLFTLVYFVTLLSIILPRMWVWLEYLYKLIYRKSTTEVESVLEQGGVDRQSACGYNLLLMGAWLFVFFCSHMSTPYNDQQLRFSIIFWPISLILLRYFIIWFIRSLMDAISTHTFWVAFNKKS